MLARLSIDVIHVVPAAVPPLKAQPSAAPEHRLRMVELALEGRPKVVIDGRELERAGTSYTVLTLESIHAEWPGSRLVLIVGRDAFDSLPKWHRFEDLRALADIAVVNRPGFDDPGRLPDWLAGETPATAVDALAPPGRVIAVGMPPCDISATALRRALAGHGRVEDMLPPPVLSYIREHHLYE